MLHRRPHALSFASTWGTRSLVSNGKHHALLALFFDLTITKYAAASSLELVSGFYFVTFANAEVLLDSWCSATSPPSS